MLPIHAKSALPVVFSEENRRKYVNQNNN